MYVNLDPYFRPAESVNLYRIPWWKELKITLSSTQNWLSKSPCWSVGIKRVDNWGIWHSILIFRDQPLPQSSWQSPCRTPSPTCPCCSWRPPPPGSPWSWKLFLAFSKNLTPLHVLLISDMNIKYIGFMSFSSALRKKCEDIEFAVTCWSGFE